MDVSTPKTQPHPAPARRAGGFAARLGELGAGEHRVLNHLLRYQRSSRSAIAAKFGFSKTKTNSLVTSLLDSGFVVEAGDGVPTAGRSAAALCLRHDVAYVVGVDLGATNVRVAVSDARRRVLALHERPLDVGSGPSTCLKSVTELIRRALHDAAVDAGQLAAIGMGVPGPVEYGTGLLIAPPIMPGWDGYAVRDHLAEEFGTAVFIDNEVNLMALGEMWHGDPGMRNALFVKVSTGIGAGILCRGEIYRGADGAAGDIGHVSVDEGGPRCTCGNAGCLEAVASGAAIALQAQAAARGGESELLARLCRERGALTLDDVGQAVREGDRAAVGILKESGRCIGGVLAGLVNFFNPERIVIGGSITRTGYLFLAAVRHAVYNRSLPLSTRHLAIEYSGLEGRAGVSGAMILAWQELLHRPAGGDRGAAQPWDAL